MTQDEWDTKQTFILSLPKLSHQRLIEEYKLQQQVTEMLKNNK